MREEVHRDRITNMSYVNVGLEGMDSDKFHPLQSKLIYDQKYPGCRGRLTRAFTACHHQPLGVQFINPARDVVLKLPASTYICFQAFFINYAH